MSFKKIAEVTQSNIMSENVLRKQNRSILETQEEREFAPVSRLVDFEIALENSKIYPILARHIDTAVQLLGKGPRVFKRNEKMREEFMISLFEESNCADELSSAFSSMDIELTRELRKEVQSMISNYIAHRKNECHAMKFLPRTLGQVCAEANVSRALNLLELIKRIRVYNTSAISQRMPILTDPSNSPYIRQFRLWLNRILFLLEDPSLHDNTMPLQTKVDCSCNALIRWLEKIGASKRIQETVQGMRSSIGFCTGYHYFQRMAAIAFRGFKNSLHSTDHYFNLSGSNNCYEGKLECFCLERLLCIEKMKAELWQHGDEIPISLLDYCKEQLHQLFPMRLKILDDKSSSFDVVCLYLENFCDYLICPKDSRFLLLMK